MRFFIMLLWGAAMVFAADGQFNSVSSPDGHIQVKIKLDNGRLYYSVNKNNQQVITPSRLGLKLKKQMNLDKNLNLDEQQLSSMDTVWTTVWGENKKIRNHYNQLSFVLSHNTGIQQILDFRVFNDGIAFRYRIPEQKGLKQIEMMDELTEFNIDTESEAWWIPAFAGNRYEYLYQHTPLNKIDTVHTPVTFKTANGSYVSVHEAALTDYSSMTVTRTTENKLRAYLVPWSDGVKVKTSVPMHSPWRTVQIADRPAGLVESSMILNLNEPNQLEDVSWIQPGKYVGIWWEMHLEVSTWGSGRKHGATTDNAKRYIDFAAEHGFDGVLVEGWNIGWDGSWMDNGEMFDFTQPYPDFALREVARYARDRGVRLIGHHETGGGVLNYESQMQDAFDLYESLGVRAVKTGYVSQGQSIKRVDEQGSVHQEWQHGQFMVQHYRKVVKEAAKHKMMLDVHEPVKATGIRRTWPNMMTREGARGQEYNAWDPNGGNPPDHTTILPFTRMLGGPMDFTPGIFDLLFEDAKPDNRVNTTLAKQLALYVVIYSPLHMAADLPENYEKRPDAFQFIVDVPTDWSETHVLNAEIGDYITVVRRDRQSADWYIGSITDENGRSFDINLGFLDPDREYIAEIYRDGEAADRDSNPYDIEIVKKRVTADSVFSMKLAPGGGLAARFRALD
ncbi:MAG: glycoside hydrolase family 97 protein [candidate division KSB1 bacterium]|nr:glycoside hydrolase family 97 protein [candidate division KSB1 bacterium]